MAATKTRRNTIKKQGLRGSDTLVVRFAASGMAPSHDPTAAEISVTPQVLQDLISHIRATKGLLTGWGEAMGRAERSGRSVRMTVIVDPRGNAPEIEVEDVEETKDDLDIALSEARARGAVKVADILNAKDMLTADQFAELIGATRETVHQKRKRHEVLGLEGPRRGVRFPAWQLANDGKLLPALPRLFKILGDHPWAIYRFLLQEHPELGGKTALDALRSNRIEDVVGTADAISSGAFA